MQDKKNYSQMFLQTLLVLLDILIIILILNLKKSLAVTEKAEMLAENLYYSSHVLTEENKEQLPRTNDYLLYFRSDSCPACQEADEIMNAYLEKNYGQAVPVYFVEANHVQSMFEDEKYGIEVTPTMIYVDSEEKFRKAEGSEEIFEMLDEIVRMVTS